MRYLLIVLCLMGLLVIVACEKKNPEKIQEIKTYTLRVSEAVSLGWDRPYLIFCGTNKADNIYSLACSWGHGTVNFDYQIGKEEIYFCGVTLEIMEVSVDQIKFKVKPNLK
jgi:hypothetical protein